MGRVYTANFNAVAVTTAQDLFELTAQSTGVCRILACRIWQTSDYGDAASEGLQIRISRYASSGSGGSTATPRPHHVGDPAAGETVEINNTTQGGTETILLTDGFNIQAGWIYQPTPDEYLYVAPSGIIAVVLPVAPTDSLTMSGSLTYERLG